MKILDDYRESGGSQSASFQPLAALASDVCAPIIALFNTLFHDIRRSIR
jgi:hypothetical protein